MLLPCLSAQPRSSPAATSAPAPSLPPPITKDLPGDIDGLLQEISPRRDGPGSDSAVLSVAQQPVVAAVVGSGSQVLHQEEEEETGADPADAAEYTIDFDEDAIG